MLDVLLMLTNFVWKIVQFIPNLSLSFLMQIRDETGCRIDMPGSGSDSDIITIIGRKEAVEKARKRILGIQEEQVCYYGRVFLCLSVHSLFQ